MKKSIPLQLVTIQLEDGKEGIFVGIPLLTDAKSVQLNNVNEVWFSNVCAIPNSLPVAQLIEMAQAQLSKCQGNMH